MPSFDIYLLSYSLTLFDTIQIAFAYVSRSLNQSELNILFDAVEEYLDARGKGVVV